MKDGKVSIVTVAFNSVGTLRDTMDSVLQQSYNDFEHVIIDGGSTDGTVELIQEYESKYNGRLKWTSEPDEGIYDAMNKGVDAASGEIVGILNSDDLYAHDQVIARIVNQFRRTNCDALYADLVYVDWSNTNRSLRTWRAGRGNYKWGWCPPHPTLYLKSEIYSEYGFYRRDFKISSDYDYMLRLFAKSPAVPTSYLNEIVVKMRHGGSSTRGLKSNWLAFTEAQESLSTNGIGRPLIVNALRVLRKLRQMHAPRSWASEPIGLP